MNNSKLHIYNTSTCTFQIRKLSNYMEISDTFKRNIYDQCVLSIED